MSNEKAREFVRKYGLAIFLVVVALVLVVVFSGYGRG